MLAAVPDRVRDGNRVPARLRAAAGRRAVRRADDRPVLGARADQRSGLALQADQEGRSSRPPRDTADAGEPCAGQQPVHPAPRLVPDRGLPLSAPNARADGPQGRTAGNRLHAPHRTRPDRVPPEHVRGAPARAGSRDYYEALVVDDAELERGRASGRLVDDTRLRDALRARSGVRRRSEPAFGSDPDAGRGCRVRRRGSGSRGGGRRAAPAAAGRAREPALAPSSNGWAPACIARSLVPRCASWVVRSRRRVEAADDFRRPDHAAKRFRLASTRSSATVRRCACCTTRARRRGSRGRRRTSSASTTRSSRRPGLSTAPSASRTSSPGSSARSRPRTSLPRSGGAVEQVVGVVDGHAAARVVDAAAEVLAGPSS